MCKRRKRRNQKTQTKTTKHKRKPCKNSICRWVIRKIKRCIRRNLYGDPSMRFNEYMIATFSSLKNKITHRKSKRSLSKDNITGPFEDAEQLKKRFSLSLSQKVMLDKYVKEYNEGKIASPELELLKTDPNAKTINKDKLVKVLGEYLKKSRKKSVISLYKNKRAALSKLNINDIELIEGLDAHDLKEEFNVQGSRAMLLEGMVDDYKKGKISLTGIVSHKSRVNEKPLTKARLDKMLEKYETGKRKQVLKDILENVGEKKKFNINATEKKVLDQMIEDFEKGKISKTYLKKFDIDINKMSKQKLQQLFKSYDTYKQIHKSGVFNTSKLKGLLEGISIKSHQIKGIKNIFK